MAKNRICPKCGLGVESGHECIEDGPSVQDIIKRMKLELKMSRKTHIVAVLEYPPEDSANLCFIDLNKFDKDNEVHAAYLEAIKQARKNEVMDFDSHKMVMYGNKEMKKVVVKPTRRKPLEVKEVLTIWG